MKPSAKILFGNTITQTTAYKNVACFFCGLGTDHNSYFQHHVLLTCCHLREVCLEMMLSEIFCVYVCVCYVCQNILVLRYQCYASSYKGEDVDGEFSGPLTTIKNELNYLSDLPKDQVCKYLFFV